MEGDNPPNAPDNGGTALSDQPASPQTLESPSPTDSEIPGPNDSDLATSTGNSETMAEYQSIPGENAQLVSESAADQNEETEALLNELAGDTDDDNPDEESEINQDLQAGHEPVAADIQPLPDLEIEGEHPPDLRGAVPTDSVSPPSPNLTRSTNDSTPVTKASTNAHNTGGAGNRGSGEGNSEGVEEDENTEKEKKQQQMGMAPGYPAPPMMQSNVFGWVGVALGSLVGGVLSGSVGLIKGALGLGDQDKDKVQAVQQAALKNTSAAANDQSHQQQIADWRQTRFDGEFARFQQEMDAHLQVMDRLENTELAKLKQMEESADPAVRARVPEMVKEAKKKLDYRGVDRDLGDSLQRIEQCAKRVGMEAQHNSDDFKKFEASMARWQEEAKKRLDCLPEHEKNSMMDRIQQACDSVMNGLRAIFSKSMGMR